MSETATSAKSASGSKMSNPNHQRAAYLQGELLVLKTEEKAIRVAIATLMAQETQLQVEALEIRSRMQSMPKDDEDKRRDAEVKGPRVTRQTANRSVVDAGTMYDGDDVNLEAIDLGLDPIALLEQMKNFVTNEGEEEEDDDDDDEN